MKDKPSIYRVAPAATNAQQLAPPGRQILDLQGFRFDALPYARALRTRRHVVEVAQASVALRAPDQMQMWNPGVQAELPSESDAVPDSEERMS